jgi:ATP-binding cassette subfamily F protein 3
LAARKERTTSSFAIPPFAVPAEAGSAKGGIAKEDRREERRFAAQARDRTAQLRKPLERRLRDLERSLDEHGSRLKALDVQLADPAFYHAGDSAEVTQALKLRAEIGAKVEALEGQWLQCQEELERVAL